MMEDKRLLKSNSFIVILSHKCQVSESHCSYSLSDVTPALIEPVDPDDVDVRKALSLPDSD